MTDDELTHRIESLETRLTHQETALEELTRALLTQDQLIREQAESIKRITSQLRALAPSPLAFQEEETPPPTPHY
jgi:uncharacterized coiled-coil protein SlyX